MIARKRVRLPSLLVVALMLSIGVRGIISGLSASSDLPVDADHPPSSTASKRTAGVVNEVVDGDTTQDDVDAYGRLLRYVEVSGRDIGRAQVRSGAATARISSTPLSRVGGYQRAEAQARAEGAGTRGACE